MTLDQFVFYLALVGYLAGTLHYLFNLKGTSPRIGAIATGATLAGFVLHTLSHILRVLALGRPPVANPYDSLSLFAWAVVLIYLAVEFRYRNRTLGAFALPLALLAASGAAALPERMAALPPKVQGLGLSVHILLAIFGNAAFALTFCAGLMYLLQERQLKARHPHRLRLRLPSLELLDDVGVKSVLIGFPLMTLALISGSAWAEYARGSFLTLRAREVWSVASWLIYAGLLYARVSAGWRGRKAALLAILGFCLVLITFIGVKVLRGGTLL
jgi:cytochrome c-type biogenesis protein CcsB